MPLTLNGTTGEIFPSWTTAGRPSTPTAGQTGYNSTLNQLEVYNGSAWGPLVTTVTPGTVLQVVNSVSLANTTGTTIIPADDTIPQNTEGTEFITATITPKSETSKLYIHFNGAVSASAAVYINAALFQDSTANALSASLVYSFGGGTPNILTVDYSMTSGTTSATTFKIRIGPGSAATVAVNGIYTGRFFGGVSQITLTITEIAA